MTWRRIAIIGAAVVMIVLGWTFTMRVPRPKIEPCVAPLAEVTTVTVHSVSEETAHQVVPATMGAEAANDLFNVKVASEDSDTVRVLILIAHDATRPVAVRNYAIQHLSIWAENQRSPDAIAELASAALGEADDAIRDIAIYSLARVCGPRSQSAAIAAPAAAKAISEGLVRTNSLGVRVASARAAQFRMTPPVATALEDIAKDGAEAAGLRAAAIDALTAAENAKVAQIARQQLTIFQTRKTPRPLVLACERAAGICSTDSSPNESQHL